MSEGLSALSCVFSRAAWEPAQGGNSVISKSDCNQNTDFLFPLKGFCEAKKKVFGVIRNIRFSLIA